MMNRKVVFLAILVCPLTVQAQRGGGGGGGAGSIVERGDRRANYKIDAGGGAITISTKDVESLSPVKYFMDKKKDLALTDDQLKKLKDMDAALKTQNDTLFHQIDSLRKEMKMNANASNPQVEQMRVRGARSSMVEVIKAIRANYDKVEPDALAVLAEAQQKTGSALLDKHQEEAEKMLQEKLGGGRRGG